MLEQPVVQLGILVRARPRVVSGVGSNVNLTFPVHRFKTVGEFGAVATGWRATSHTASPQRHRAHRGLQLQELFQRLFAIEARGRSTPCSLRLCGDAV